MVFFSLFFMTAARVSVTAYFSGGWLETDLYNSVSGPFWYEVFLTSQSSLFFLGIAVYSEGNELG